MTPRPRHKKIGLLIIGFSILLSLVACAPKVYAPVEERSVFTERQQIQKRGGHLIRIVKPGDTLYGIAFESNLSVRKLAAWNQINDYKNLKVGQSLRLTAPLGFVERQPSRVVTVKPLIDEPLKSVAIEPEVLHQSDQSTLNKSVVVEGSTTKGSVKTTRNQTVPTSKPISSEPLIKQPVSKTLTPLTSKVWAWPVTGKVLRSFSLKDGRQGIDISVAPGQAVVASQAGEVVYVGNSLKGYGNLIIIKHHGDFLSAYAHNSSTLVKEGQFVRAKQRIGFSGLNNRGEAALQFQIRIDGNSVNPMNYLKPV